MIRTFTLIHFLLGFLLLNLHPAFGQTIFSVAGNGTSFLAGNGPSGYLIGDGGIATNASISFPMAVASDQNGNIYISDYYANAIRKVNASDNKISTVAGTGTADGRAVGGGLATSTGLNGVIDLEVDASGNIYILDMGNYCIWKVNASDRKINIIEKFGGDLSFDGYIGVDAASNIYFAKGNTIRKINANKPSTIIAGNGLAGYSGDGGLATNALIKSGSIAVDASGDIYLAADNRIRKINAVDGKINTIAGNGTAGFSGDGGLAINATVENGRIAIDASGNIYVSGNNRVRKINAADGIITTIAGNGTAGFSGDGDLATNATFKVIAGIAVDGNENVYVADANNFRIRKILNQVGPTIISQPISVTVNTEESAEFTVLADGSGLRYQWQVDTGNGTYINITDGDVYSGATTAKLILKLAQTSMNGYRYRVQVSSNSIRLSSSATLTVKEQVADQVGDWQIVGQAGFSGKWSSTLSLAHDASGTPFLAFSDGENSSKVAIKKFIENRWIDVENSGMVSGYSYYTNLAIDSKDVIYIAYRDDDKGYNPVVKKCIGNNWVELNNSGLTSGIVQNINFVLDANGIPFISYVDEGNGFKATVKKYINNNWVEVGTLGIGSPSLAIDNQGNPVIAFADKANNYKAIIKKYTGSNWIDVGNPLFSAGWASNLTLALDANGTPYVAYPDGANNYKARVKKFDGNNWVDVGASEISIGNAQSINLKVDANGTPFIGYSDWPNGNKATVKRYNGNSWVDVGIPGFSPAAAFHMNLAFDATGTPYVAFADEANYYKATVMKYTTYVATPVINGLTEDTGLNAIDRITFDQSLKISGTADANATIKIYQSGKALLGSVKANSEGSWVFDNSAIKLEEGTHSFTATATINGKTSPTSLEFVIIIDATKPPSPTDLHVNVKDKQLFVNGTAEPESWVIIYRGSSEVGTVKIDNTGKWETTLNLALVEDNYIFTTVAVDIAGNKSDASQINYSHKINKAPSAILLTQTAIAENNKIGTKVGSLSTIDQDANDQHTFTLVTGLGDSDNAYFKIVENDLVTTQVFDFETKDIFTIRIQVKDAGGLTFETSLNISVMDLAEPISAIPTITEEIIRLHPNPANSYILIDSKKNIDKVEFINAYGSIVLVKSGGTNRIQVDTSNLKPGVYIALITSNGSIYSRRIIVVRS